MRIFKLSLLALAVTALVPSAAMARHGHPNTFERTFPAESRLCAAAAAGDVPTFLQGHEADVTAACEALHSAYDAAVAAAGAGGDASALKDAVAQVQTACGGDTVDPAACADALRGAYKSLKTSRHGDKHAYRRAIEQARHTFRHAIKSLFAGGPHGHDAPAGDGDAPTGDAPAGDAPTTD